MTDACLVIFSELIHVNVFLYIYIYMHYTFWKDICLSVSNDYFYHHWVDLKLAARVEINRNNFYFLISFLLHYLNFK